MKKLLISLTILMTCVAIFLSTLNSCSTVASSPIGLTVIKQVLLSGISKGAKTYGDKKAFLESDLIDNALPQQLREINNVLAKISPSLVTKEKEYIAEAAAYTVNISEPILKNAVNGLTTADAQRIIQGEPGTATLVLKEKTSVQLVQAITPKVDEKLNEYGIVKTINTALKGNSLLGSLLGGQSSSGTTSADLSRLASEQLVNGMFSIIKDYEIQNQSNIPNSLKGGK